VKSPHCHKSLFKVDLGPVYNGDMEESSCIISIGISIVVVVVVVVVGVVHNGDSIIEKR